MQENKQEKSPIKQNILLYLAKKGVTPYEFYKVSGVTRGILQQNNGISEDNLARFLVYAPDINIEWLLTGKGDMLKECDNIPSIQEKPESPNVLKPSTTPIDLGSCAQKVSIASGPDKGIPLIPLSAMAGVFTGETSVMEYE